MKVEMRPIPQGIMVWWDKQEDAARYNVGLFIGKTKKLTVEGQYNLEGNIEPCKGKHVEQEVLESYQPLCIVEKDRHTFYHTFTGLANSINIAYGNGHIKYPYNNGCNGAIQTNFKYFVSVEAEDQAGNVIDKSEMIW